MSEPLEAIQAELHDLKNGQDDVLKEVRKVNGFVQRNSEELFGDEKHGTVGAISRIRVLEDLALQAKTAVRVVIGLITVIGVTNILLLIRS